MITRIMGFHSEDKNPQKAKNVTEVCSTETCASVNTGICGFSCRIKAWKIDKRAVGLEISGSECQQIQQFSDILSMLALKDVFKPVTCNPVYLAAERTGCHPSCPVPTAVLKAAEVALGMALPRDVEIRFKPCQREDV